MLLFRVFAKLRSRRSHHSFFSQTPIPCSPFPNSHGINLFAAPHPLTSVSSILYKNIGDRGAPITTSRLTQRPSLGPLDATLTDAFVCVADKGLIRNTKSFRCNTYKKQGVGSAMVG